MNVSTGAGIVGVLGLIFGVTAVWWSNHSQHKKIATFGGLGLLVAAIGLIVVPFALGQPW